LLPGHGDGHTAVRPGECVIEPAVDLLVVARDGVDVTVLEGEFGVQRRG
jgi:hypothetical protein